MAVNRKRWSIDASLVVGMNRSMERGPDVKRSGACGIG